MKQRDRERSDAAVVTRGLTRRFEQLTAVEHLDLVVPHGSVFGLLGRNGAGTTTIKMLITLLAPSEGTATIAGCDLRGLPIPPRCAAWSATCRRCSRRTGR